MRKNRQKRAKTRKNAPKVRKKSEILKIGAKVILAVKNRTQSETRKQKFGPNVKPVR